MKHPRRSLWGAGGALALLLLGVAAGEWAGWPFLRAPLQGAIARATEVPVLLEGRFRTRLLWRPQLSVEHLKIGAPTGMGVPHLADARGVDLAWRWGDILAWRRGAPLRLERLRAAKLDAHLVRSADGRSSWQLGSAAIPRSAEEPPLASLPRLGWLQVEQGLIMVDDAPLQARLRVDIRGGEGHEGQSAPSGTPSGYQATVTGQWRALPLDLQVRAGAALPLLQDSDSDSADLPLRVKGSAGAARIDFDGRAGALLGERRLQGALRFSGPSLAQVGTPLALTLPQTPPFELQGQIGLAEGVWQLHAQRLVVGRSQLSGDFRFDPRTHPSSLSGRLLGPRLVLADLAPAVGMPSGAPPPAAGRVLPQRRFDLPSLGAMDADLQVAIDELDFGSASLAPLRQLRTHLLLQRGVLRLDDLQATVAGGRFAGHSSLDATGQPARWAVDLRFDTVDIAGWIGGLRAPAGQAQAPSPRQGAALKRQRDQARAGGNQAVRSYLTGALTGSMLATGRGRSTAEILATLDGQARLALRDGTLSHLVTEAIGLDLAQGLGVLVRGDQPLPLHCARLDLGIRDGIVQPRVAVIDSADSTILITGQVNLRDETLAKRPIRLSDVKELHESALSAMPEGLRLLVP